MTILLSDQRVRSVPVREDGDALMPLHPRLAPGVSGGSALVRRRLADLLIAADAALPAGLGLRVVEGHRTPTELRALTSRFVAPLEVAPHVAGAAVDLTLVDADGRDLDLGTPIDATPEQSAGRCYLAAAGVSAQARAHRLLLARVLVGVGLVDYPTEWWHWSFGDRYWALVTGAPAALYGPVDARVPA